MNMQELGYLSDDNQHYYDINQLEEHLNQGSKKIVGVKFEDRFNPKTFVGREYSYYTDLELQKDDIVEVPTKNGKGIALVSRLDVKPEEIESIKEYMKEITTKLDREEYLNNGIKS